MSSLSEILIIGAGVLGLCTAAELLRRGHEVTVVDPGGANASAIAAGMIAPAFESLADWRASDGQVDRSDMFQAARDQWPAFAGAFDLPLYREGAEWRGPNADEVLAGLIRLGFTAERTAHGVVCPDDWRVDAPETLARLRTMPGVRLVKARATTLSADGKVWRAVLADGTAVTAATVVLATGATTMLTLPDTVTRLTAQVRPIKGQIAYTTTQLVTHAVRGPAGYIAPAAGGAVIGATMEPDRCDTVPDPEQGARLLRACLDQAGITDSPAVSWAAGLRGASPDGLPMAGPSEDGRLYLALAPRRNGWLLGPLVARTVADGIEGRDAGAFAQALDPRRFI